MPINNISQRNVEELDSEIELENSKKIEAALFLSGRFMTIQELITLTDVNPIILRKTILVIRIILLLRTSNQHLRIQKRRIKLNKTLPKMKNKNYKKVMQAMILVVLISVISGYIYFYCGIHNMKK